MNDNSPAEAFLPALSHASLAASASDWITNRILEGRIRPGERITEISLAEQMGVSRSPVREALHDPQPVAVERVRLIADELA